MKYILSLILVFCALNYAVAQVVVGDVDINKDEKIQIIEVLITERFSSKSVNVFVDYGQKTNFRAGSIDGDDKDRMILEPETKKEKRFASTAALLSFLDSRGWEHYDSLIYRDNTGVSAYYYFRKK